MILCWLSLDSANGFYDRNEHLVKVDRPRCFKIDGVDLKLIQ
jgi:hypothetical protein